MEKEEFIISEFSRLSFEVKDTFLNHASKLVNEWNDYYNKEKNLFAETERELLNGLGLFDSYKSYFDVLELNKFEDWNIEFQKDQQRHKEDGHNFNIFHLLKKEFDFNIQETMHSKLIKFLLDSSESHGLENIFLFEFLEFIGIESPEKGTWQVTAEQGKIDILIQRSNPQSVIVVENKSNWACDQENQLYRYWHKAIYLKTKRIERDFYDKNKQNYQIIYLSPNSYKQYEDQSISKPKNDQFDTYKGLPERIPMEIIDMTFDKDIQKWLDVCKDKIPETNHRIREYISQYQMLCKTL